MTHQMRRPLYGIALLLLLALCMPRGEQMAERPERRASLEMPTSEATCLPASACQPKAPAAALAKRPSPARPSQRATSVSGQVEYVQAAGRSRPVVAGEVLIRFGRDKARDEIAQTLKAAGMSLLEWSPALGAARARLPESMTVAKAIGGRWAGDVGLPPAEPNAIAWAASDNGSDVQPPSEPEAENNAPVQAECAEFIPDQRIVAVLDTGVAYRDDPEVPEIQRAPHLRSDLFVAGYDFVDNDPFASDEHQHGTHVASAIVKLTGKHVRIMPIRVLDENALGTEFDVAQGIVLAVDRCAEVINLSLTFGPYYIPSQVMANAIDHADAHQVPIVGAAGNDGAQTVSFPAALRSVIAVGATNHKKRVARYSNRGSALDCVAPGGGLPEDKKGIARKTMVLNEPSNFEKVRLSGTSMASAFAAAVAVKATVDLEGMTTGQFRALMLAGAKANDGYDPSRGQGQLADKFKFRDIKKEVSEIYEEISYADVSILLEQRLEDGPAFIRGVAHVEIADEERRPIANARVFADWLGSWVGPGDCVTDALGRCLMESLWIPTGDPELSEPRPVLLSVRVNRVVREEGRLSMPLPSFRVGDARAQAYLANRGDDPPAQVVTRFEAATPTETSMLAGRSLTTSYQYRTLGPALAGSSLVLAFDEAFAAQLDPNQFDELDDGLRLLCDGPGEPLVWINDCTVETVALGAGLIASGMTSADQLLPAWAFTKLYANTGDWVAMGEGLIASGWTTDVLSFSEAWFDQMVVSGCGLIASGWTTELLDAPLGWFDTYFAYGSGLIASGWVINSISMESFLSLNEVLVSPSWSVTSSGLIASGRTTFLPFLYFNQPYVVVY